LGDMQLLRLLQLASPALPIGGFAYSQGLEYAACAGWVHDAESTSTWLRGLLQHSLTRLDLPLLGSSYAAFRASNVDRARYYARMLHAARETPELEHEERQLGQALARCLVTLGVEPARAWTTHQYSTLLTLFALASAHWEIPVESAGLGYCMSWAQNQVSAALRLLSIGQFAGQRMLSELLALIPAAVDSGLTLSDENEIGFLAPAQVLASALHETQYSRLFRS
jgi:urease accessory protein